MNARRAKHLRRIAEAATEGLPAVEYQPQRGISKQAITPKGLRHYGVLTELRLTAACTRGVYQSLKRGRPTKVIEFTGRRQTRAERQRAERDNVTLVGA